MAKMEKIVSELKQHKALAWLTIHAERLRMEMAGGVCADRCALCHEPFRNGERVLDVEDVVLVCAHRLECGKRAVAFAAERNAKRIAEVETEVVL